MHEYSGSRGDRADPETEEREKGRKEEQVEQLLCETYCRYNNLRFDSSFDEVTGFKTHSVLAVCLCLEDIRGLAYDDTTEDI